MIPHRNLIVFSVLVCIFSWTLQIETSRDHSYGPHRSKQRSTNDEEDDDAVKERSRGLPPWEKHMKQGFRTMNQETETDRFQKERRPWKDLVASRSDRRDLNSRQESDRMDMKNPSDLIRESAHNSDASSTNEEEEEEEESDKTSMNGIGSSNTVGNVQHSMEHLHAPKTHSIVRSLAKFHHPSSQHKGQEKLGITRPRTNQQSQGSGVAPKGMIDRGNLLRELNMRSISDDRKHMAFEQSQKSPVKQQDLRRHRVFQPPVVEQKQIVMDKGGLMEDMPNERHSVYVDHVNHVHSMVGHTKPKPMIQFREAEDEQSVKHHQPRVPPVKMIQEEPMVNFASGSFGQKTAEKPKQTPLASRMENRKENQIKNGKLPKHKGMKNWMNFRLLVDDSGSLNIVMGPPKNEDENSQNIKGNSGTLVNSAVNGREQNKESLYESDPIESSPMQAQAPSRVGRPMTTWRRGSFHTPDSESRMEGARNEYRSYWPHGSMDNPSMDAFAKYQGMRRHATKIPSWQQGNNLFQQPPSLLFDQMDDGQSNRDQRQMKTTVNKPKMRPMAIPPQIIIDEPSDSGCPKQQCADVCPGDLRKLSTTNGCPTCECCPAIVCKMACKIGYDADEHGCPMCKCLDK